MLYKVKSKEVLKELNEILLNVDIILEPITSFLNVQEGSTNISKPRLIFFHGQSLLKVK